MVIAMVQFELKSWPPLEMGSAGVKLRSGTSGCLKMRDSGASEERRGKRRFFWRLQFSLVQNRLKESCDPT